MPRPATRPRVPRINLEVVRRAFRSLPSAGESDYYILEKADGPCLRVRRTVVQIGVRCGSRFHISANLHPEMTLEEVEAARAEARLLQLRLESEPGIPGLTRRPMTLQQLYNEYMGDLKENRSASRSPRSLEIYERLWRVHILPSLGHLRISDINTEVVQRFKRQVPKRVLEERPKYAKAGGKATANRALQQLEAALGYAYRMEWIHRNPASAKFVTRYEERRCEDFLDADGYAAVGQVLRVFEDRLARGMPLGSEGRSAPRVSLRTLYALRLAIYTGARQRSELLWTRLDWCHLDSDVPRIGIPRAKGDRAQGGGRWIFLGPEAVRLIKAIPRPAGSEHLTVPGNNPGKPHWGLNHTWRTVLRAAGQPRMAVKVLRHGFSTHSVGIIAPEHRAQLLGHQGRPMTDTVYLHHHGPDLALAAARVENHLRVLLGDLQPCEAYGSSYGYRGARLERGFTKLAAAAEEGS